VRSYNVQLDSLSYPLFCTQVRVYNVVLDSVSYNYCTIYHTLYSICRCALMTFY
jgi:hypothetical protein